MQRSPLIALLALLVLCPATASAAETIAVEQGRVHADAFGKRIAWSSFDPAARVWRLKTRQRGRIVTTRAPTSAHPFRLDVGPGPEGTPVAVYPRCEGEDCDLFLYDFAARRQRKLRGVSTRHASESLPSVWRNRIAFSRRAGGMSTMYVSRLDGRRARVLPGGWQTGPSGPIALELSGRRAAFVWSRQGTAGFTETELHFVRRGHRRILDRTSSGPRKSSTFVTPEFRGRRIYYARPVDGPATGNQLRRVNLESGRIRYVRAPYKGLVTAVWMTGRFLLSRAIEPEFDDPEAECRPPGSDPEASVCHLTVGDPVDGWTRLSAGAR